MHFTWEKIAEMTPLGLRSRQAACADFANDRLIFFGGLRGADGNVFPLDDTWLFEKGIWKQNRSSPHPPALHRASMAFDTKRNVAVLFGGQSRNLLGGWPLNGRTWEFDGARWSVRTTKRAPKATCAPAMCFHEGLGMTVLFGGSPNVNETWVYDGVEWEPWEGEQEPPPREYPMMAYDFDRRKCVLFGGNVPANDLGNKKLLDIWEFDAEGWQQVSEISDIGGHDDCGMAFHPTAREVMFIGSSSGDSFGTFAFARANWRQVDAGAQEPAIRQCGSLLAGRGVLVLNGGEEHHDGPQYSDMWQLFWRE